MILVTGAAGFIGHHVCRAILARGWRCVGIDNLNDYYDVGLKRARLAATPGLEFVEGDIADPAVLADLHPHIDRVIHLAAYAGIRHPVANDFAQSNLVGHLNMLEFCRQRGVGNFVYASSSAVYGNSTRLPFRVGDAIQPISLYGATKAANEVLSESYSHLYDFPQTGLRFFTVYGPWGRPDMAMWLFTDAILSGRPIEVFGHGQHRRDFVFIDDVVSAVMAALDRPSHNALYNVGAETSVGLLDLIETIEWACGHKAERILLPVQDGDVNDTYADVAETRRDLNFDPKTTLDDGIPQFVDWLTKYRQ